MLAALEDERHVVGLQMVTDTLVAAGFDVMALGADVPLDALLAAIARYAPAVLGRSVTMPAGPRLPETLARIREVDPELRILVGGAGASDARHLDETARILTDAADAVGAVEAALRAA